MRRRGRRACAAPAPDPNGRRAPRCPQRPPGLTEAQGLEVALGVGERCTVTRAIEARRGPPVRPSGGGLTPWRGQGSGAEVARRRPQGAAPAAAPRAPAASRRLRRGGAGPAGHNEAPVRTRRLSARARHRPLAASLR